MNLLINGSCSLAVVLHRDNMEETAQRGLPTPFAIVSNSFDIFDVMEK